MAALKQSLLDFFKGESAVGVLLILATLLALLLANSPYAATYQNFLDIPVVVSVHEFVIAKPLLLWVNDGLMAVFFFMVGLEIKREVLEGSLSHISKVALPAFAALGGMIVPALVYSLFNWGDTTAMQGWAIPMATDIAFALGILSLRQARPRGTESFSAGPGDHRRPGCDRCDRPLFRARSYDDGIGSLGFFHRGFDGDELAGCHEQYGLCAFGPRYLGSCLKIGGACDDSRRDRRASDPAAQS